MVTAPLDEDDPFHYPPTPVLPEMYMDLDLQLFTACDDAARWAAVVAGTREVLDQFDHLASPKIRTATGPEVVISKLGQCVREFETHGAPDMASWLQTVIDVLALHLELQQRCADDIRRATSTDDAIAAITEAAALLTAAAETMATYPFEGFPPYRSTRPDYQLMGNTGTCLPAETHRVPLRKHLDGVGGVAARPNSTPISTRFSDWNWPRTAACTGCSTISAST